MNGHDSLYVTVMKYGKYREVVTLTNCELPVWNGRHGLGLTYMAWFWVDFFSTTLKAFPIGRLPLEYPFSLVTTIPFLLTSPYSLGYQSGRL